MPGAYTVSVASFEGPFDLLLQLIAKHQVDIYDIPLAEITDDYLAVLRRMDDVDLEVTTEFLMIAATLLELKAARLLPGEDDPELEESALEARDLLYARLLDYRVFKEAAAFLADAMERCVGYFPRTVGPDEEFTGLRPAPQLGVDAAGLARLAARVFADQPAADVDTSHLQPVRMTVAEAADMVLGELARAGGRATFRELTAGCRHRVEVIVCFLALLELYKHEHVDVAQATSFGDLVIEGAGPGGDAAGAEAGPVVITETYEYAAPAEGPTDNNEGAQPAEGPTDNDEYAAPAEGPTETYEGAAPAEEGGYA